MIQEEFVTFETAKLLKEAGFQQWVMTPTGERDGVPCVKCYRKDGLLTDWIFMRGHKSAFSAPTQAQAMRWLREEKNLIVEPRPTWPYDGNAKCVVTKWCAVILSMFEHPIAEEEVVLINTLVYFPTYEAAAEAGIQAACKYLIEKGGKQ